MDETDLENTVQQAHDKDARPSANVRVAVRRHLEALSLLSDAAVAHAQLHSCYASDNACPFSWVPRRAIRVNLPVCTGGKDAVVAAHGKYCRSLAARALGSRMAAVAARGRGRLGDGDLGSFVAWLRDDHGLTPTQVGLLDVYLRNGPGAFKNPKLLRGAIDGAKTAYHQRKRLLHGRK